MKKIFSIILILLSLSAAFGQDKGIESLMTRRYLSCEDIYYNVTFLIPEFYNKNEKDTLQEIITYWEKKCGNSEPLTRCKILLSIENHTFNESLYDFSIIYNLLNYGGSYLNDKIYDRNEFDSYYWQYVVTQDNLDLFTLDLAKSLLNREDLSAVEKFIVNIYAGTPDISFGVLATEDFYGTKIQQYYFEAVGRLKQAYVGHFDMGIGAWAPLDNLTAVGGHTTIVFRGGVRYKQAYADAALGFKFGRSQEIYQVQVNDSIWDTDYFFGGYVGLDVGQRFLKAGKNSFDIIGGIAYDGFSALNVTNTNSKTDVSKSINSLNLNVGLGYKYYSSPWNYYGVDVKYNFVDFQNAGGTDLDGNVITVNFMYGFFGGKNNDIRLEELGYKK